MSLTLVWQRIGSKKKWKMNLHRRTIYLRGKTSNCVRRLRSFERRCRPGLASWGKTIRFTVVDEGRKGIRGRDTTEQEGRGLKSVLVFGEQMHMGGGKKKVYIRYAMYVPTDLYSMIC